MPPTDAIPSIVWPGADGAPAWAIPVQIPSGTRGYALFVPMVPVASSPEGAGAVAMSAPAGTSPVAPSPAVKPAPSSTSPAASPSTSPSASPSTSDGEAGGEKKAGNAGGEADHSGGVSSGPADTGAAGPARPANDSATPATTPGTPGSGAPAPSTPAPSTPAPSTPGSGAPASGAPAPAEPPADRPIPVTRLTPQHTGAFGPYQPLPPSRWKQFRDKHWPGPKPARGRAVPAAVLAGAAGFVAFLPLGRVGIGWFLAALTLTAGVVFAVRRAGDLSRADRWTRIGWTASALALLLVPAFRNAWWLVTFSVLGALGCAALAIVGGRQVRSILFSLFAAPYAALRGLPWVRNHLESSGRNPGMARRVVFSAALTIVMLLVFGGLLSSADVAFSALLDDLVPDFEGGSAFEWVFLAIVGGLLAVSGVYTLSAPPVTSGLDTPGRGRFGLVEWAPAVSALVLLFAGFVGVQFTVLFGGARHVLKTSGLSYAEYARSGFWQLVAVTLLSLAVLAALARWAKRDLPVERIVLRLLLGPVCALSVVIVASALSRMWAYQRVYSFTGERIFVMSLELLLGTVFVMIAAAGIRWRGRWIPQATVGLAVVMLLGLAVLDPEGYVASRNAIRYEQTGKIDAWYLRALSADATPALTHLPDPVRRCTLSWIADELEQPDPWYAWNLGRTRARAALKSLGSGAIGNQKDCRRADQFDLPKTRN
ncbi:hypothetical protein Aph02nite_14470 [Actinoplanes philippinensis]|uniref:Uncharacterized protein n=1 Tax=Actinoplanes philippinensis TaxID=35752 RepID=A0A1I1ZG79_9ACTN|nr:DUF4173 domain-containing protein [Actinoplanes philippinensis]GIE75497.1 hypothetical protein Aph02nite_14470 [Actinoplanes philippinensis]SFE30766.1 protein of unknown function [Actinoplanes philippinensis]